MSLGEAVSWLSLAVFEPGLYFLFERWGERRAYMAVAMTIVGLLGLASQLPRYGSTAVAIFVVGILGAGLATVVRKYLALRQRPALTEATVAQIKMVGKLESLGGRADWLAENLEEVWHQFTSEHLPMPNPIGMRSVPDAIEKAADKALFRFRVHFQGYLGSMKSAYPECDSQLMIDGFPHEGENYLSVKRKIEAHSRLLNQRAASMMTAISADKS